MNDIHKSYTFIYIFHLKNTVGLFHWEPLR